MKLKPILFIIACTIFTSLGQIFWKLGVNGFILSEVFTNFNLIFGFVFYGLGLILLVMALKFGDLSLLYPFIALSFVWVALMSHFFLNERLNLIKVLAILIIIAGVSLIGYGGAEND